MKDELIKKLTSRKFIVTAISAIAGIITLFVGENEVIQIIASALMVVIPTIVYCITEGILDSKSVNTITDTIADAAEKLGASEEQVDVIEQVGEVFEVITDDTPEE